MATQLNYTQYPNSLTLASGAIVGFAGPFRNDKTNAHIAALCVIEAGRIHASFHLTPEEVEVFSHPGITIDDARLRAFKHDLSRVLEPPDWPNDAEWLRLKAQVKRIADAK